MKHAVSVVTGMLCLLCGSGNAAAANYVSEQGLWSYYEDIYVPTPKDPEDSSNTEQINLPANVFVPTTTTPGQRFPAVIFISSWALNETEYKTIAQDLADRGYLTLRYSARGFRGAPDYIDTNGKKDVADASNAISYVINNYPVDPDRIALAGTSYGAGISLTTALQDERVMTVVATSAWGSLLESLWPAGTPKDAWVKVLIGTSEKPIGRRNPEIDQNLQNMHEHQNVPATIDWALERSPISYLAFANQRERKPAIYIANNLHDYLFQPNSIIKLLEQYQGPWHVDFSFGVHGAGEAQGLTGAPEDSFVWQNAYAWFDHHMKGVNNYIDQVDRVTTRVKSTTGPLRDSFPTFPVHDELVTLFADPAPGQQGGELNATGTLNADQPVVDSSQDVVWTGGITGAQQMSSHSFRMDEIKPEGALVFKGPVLEKNLYLRGSSRLTFTGYVSHNIQYFGYLLDLDPATGVANWIGHGPFTWHRPEGVSEDPQSPVEISIDMFWTAHDVAAGHQLVLVVDGADNEYFTYADSPTEHRFVIDSEHPMSVAIPVIHTRKVLDTIERRAQLAAQQAENDADTDNSRGVGGDAAGISYGGSGGSMDLLMLFLVALAVKNLQRSPSLRARPVTLKS